jgi:hypothetical protein
MRRDDLFLETIADLRYRLRADSRHYDALLAGALLRKLLMDGDRLVDVVNRKGTRRLEVRFRVRLFNPSANPDIFFWYSGNGLDPEAQGFPGEIRELRAR